MIRALFCVGYEYVIISLDEVLTTTDDCEVRYFVDVVFECTDTIETRTQNFSLCPEPKKS